MKSFPDLIVITYNLGYQISLAHKLKETALTEQRNHEDHKYIQETPTQKIDHYIQRIYIQIQAKETNHNNKSSCTCKVRKRSPIAETGVLQIGF